MVVGYDGGENLGVSVCLRVMCVYEMIWGLNGTATTRLHSFWP